MLRFTFTQAGNSSAYVPTGTAGTLGLGPSTSNSTGYLNMLYAEGRIASKTVAWSVVADSSSSMNAASTSKISFGAGLNTTYSGSLINVQSSTSQWAFENAMSYSYGSTQISGSSLTGIINTGSSYLMKIDATSYGTLNSTLSGAGFSCNAISNKTGSGYCGTTSDCTTVAANLSNMYIAINGTKLQVSPSGYLVNNDKSITGSSTWKCMTAVQGANITATQVYLGTYFLANYYAQFNYDNSTVSLAASSVNSFNNTIVVPSDSSDDDSDGLAGWAIFLIVLASLIVVALVLGLLYKMCGKKDGDEMARDSGVYEEKEQLLEESVN